MSDMRTVLLLIVLVTACSAESVFGIWKVNTSRSTGTPGIPIKATAVRINRHAKGEVFTLDTIEADGRAISSSTILYFDAAPHDFQDLGCWGTQSSRRPDSRTIEILRTCREGGSSKLVLRFAVTSKQLTFDITEHHADGRSLEQRLILEKQPETAGMNRQHP